MMGVDPLSTPERLAMETKTMDLSQLKIERKDDEERPGPRRKIGNAVWFAITVVLIIASLVIYRFLAFTPATVEVATVAAMDPGLPTPILNATGYAVAQRRAAVASKGTGRLVELNVREGDRVKKGEVIGRLESADMAAALARARANRAVAEAARDEAKAELTEAALAYERKKTLITDGMISQSDLEAAEGRHHRAEASVGSAEAGIKAAAAAVRSAASSSPSSLASPSTLPRTQALAQA